MVAEDAPGLQAVRDQIAAMDVRDSNRRLLASIVESMVTAQAPRIVTVAPQADGVRPRAAACGELAAGGRRLSHGARRMRRPWMTRRRSSRRTCSWAVAFECWPSGRKSLACFAAASQVATMTDDVMSILRARIQEANIAIDRGNLPYAETLLDETILQAKESGLSEIRATAIHDRAHLAHSSGQVRRGGRAAVRGAARAFAIRWRAIAC